MNEHDATEQSYRKGYNDAMAIALNIVESYTGNYTKKSMKGNFNTMCENLSCALACHHIFKELEKLLKQEENSNE